MRVLLDTNVLAAGFAGLTQQTTTAAPRVLQRWNEQVFTLLTSDFVLDELDRALQSPYFARLFSADDRRRLVRILEIDATIVVPATFVHGVAPHRQDDLVLSAAVSGNADYLVTGDTEFLRVREYQGVKLRTPAEFLRELDSVAD